MVFVCVAGLLGCGEKQPPRAEISGTVKFQGKPVKDGYVVFYPLDEWEGFYSQAHIVNGEYSLKKHGPIPGNNRVEIHGYESTGQKIPNISGVDLGEAREMVDATTPFIPTKYNYASELTYEIKPGKNDGVDWDLK